MRELYPADIDTEQDVKGLVEYQANFLDLRTVRILGTLFMR